MNDHLSFGLKVSQHDRNVVRQFYELPDSDLHHCRADRVTANAKAGYSRRHLYTLENERKFPKRVTLGENRVGWIESEVDGWIAERAASRAA